MQELLAQKEHQETLKKIQRAEEVEKYQQEVYSPMRLTQSKIKPLSDFKESHDVINQSLRRHEEHI